MKTLWKKLDAIGKGSILFIVFMASVALFAYVFVPDKTQNANAMHVQLAAANPGTSYVVLVQDSPTTNTGLWPYFTGSPTANEAVIFDYKVEGNSIRYLENEKAPWKTFKLKPEQTVDDVIKHKTFVLGSDNYGRDFFSRLALGSRVSLSVGFIAVFISLIIGIPLGAIAGYYRGWVDNMIMWLINVIWSIPTLLMVIALTFVLGKGFWQVFVAVGLTMWVEVARVVRGQVLSLREMEFVDAARVLGYTNWRILFKHILPNALSPVIVISAANFASAILIESGLSFLGIGAQPPIPSWGGMIRDHYAYVIMGKPFLALLPGAAIMLSVLAFMALGNALRDVLDVKLNTAKA